MSANRRDEPRKGSSRRGFQSPCYVRVLGLAAGLRRGVGRAGPFGAMGPPPGFPAVFRRSIGRGGSIGAMDFPCRLSRRVAGAWGLLRDCGAAGIPARSVRAINPVRDHPCRTSRAGPLRGFQSPSTPKAGQSISKVRAVSLSTVMRTIIAFSGSSCSIFSGHSTRQRSPE